MSKSAIKRDWNQANRLIEKANWQRENNTQIVIKQNISEIELSETIENGN